CPRRAWHCETTPACRGRRARSGPALARGPAGVGRAPGSGRARRLRSGGAGAASRRSPSPRSAGSKPVPLFLPGVGVVVVAVQLPEAHPILAHHLELAEKLRRLPEIPLGDEQTQRRAV